METDKAVATTTANIREAVASAEIRLARFNSGNDHPDIKMPFTAKIDGREFSGSSLSLLSATISGLASSDLNGAEKIAILQFAFGAYSISVPLSVQISRIDAAKGTFRLDFTEPTGEHLPVLRHLLNSYVAGDIVSLGGVINVKDESKGDAVARIDSVRTPRERYAFIGRSLATALATAALVITAGQLVTSRLFTSQVTQLAVFSQGGEAMRAIASGQIAYLNPNAAKDDLVYAIRTASGDTLNVIMPCECKALIADVSEGSTILSGEVVVDLIRPDAAPTVEAIIEPAQAKSLLSGDIAELQFNGGTTFAAKLADGGGYIRPMPESEKMRAVFVLDGPVEGTSNRSPVIVRIVNSRLHKISSAVSRLFTL